MACGKADDEFAVQDAGPVGKYCQDLVGLAPQRFEAAFDIRSIGDVSRYKIDP